MRALKVLVVVLGILLVAGVIALVIAIVDRINHPRPALEASAATASAIDLPAGANILGTETTGDRLVVRIGLGGGGEEIFIFNLATGARVSTITLRPRPAAP